MTGVDPSTRTGRWMSMDPSPDQRPGGLRTDPAAERFDGGDPLSDDRLQPGVVHLDGPARGRTRGALGCWGRRSPPSSCGTETRSARWFRTDCHLGTGLIRPLTARSPCEGPSTQTCVSGRIHVVGASRGGNVGCDQSVDTGPLHRNYRAARRGKPHHHSGDLASGGRFGMIHRTRSSTPAGWIRQRSFWTFRQSVWSGVSNRLSPATHTLLTRPLFSGILTSFAE